MDWTKYSGILLIMTGVLHNLVGLIFGWPVLVSMHEDGWWDTIQNGAGVHYDRSAITWFLLLGFFWMLLGYLMHLWHQRLQQPLPHIIGYVFLFAGLACAVVEPQSGAWLFIPQAFVIIFNPANRFSLPKS